MSPPGIRCEFHNTQPDGGTLNKEIADMRLEIDALKADRVAMVIILTTLMTTHPNYEAMQIRLTQSLERQLSGDGALGSTLTPAQNERVRYFVEWLQAIKKA